MRVARKLSAATGTKTIWDPRCTDSVAGTNPATESCNYFFFGAAREAVFGFAADVVLALLVLAARLAGAFAVVFAITSPM
jgi:hypothetical protein